MAKSIKVGSVVRYVDKNVATFAVLVTAVDSDSRFFSGTVIATDIDEYQVGHFSANWIIDLDDDDYDENDVKLTPPTWNVLSQKQVKTLFNMG